MLRLKVLYSIMDLSLTWNSVFLKPGLLARDPMPDFKCLFPFINKTKQNFKNFKII